MNNIAEMISYNQKTALVMPISPSTFLGVVCQHVCWQVRPCIARVGVASNNSIHLPLSGRTSLLQSRVRNGVQGTPQGCVPEHTQEHIEGLPWC